MKKILLFTLLILTFTKNAYSNTFPIIKGENLNGKLIEMPKDCNKTTFIVLGYSYKARDEANKWLNEYQKKFSSNTDSYLFVMMGNKITTKAMSFIINNAMKNATPKNELNHVVTVYEDLEPIKNSLNNKDSDIYIYLLDKTGKIFFTEKGNFSKEKIKNIEEAINKSL